MNPTTPVLLVAIGSLPGAFASGELSAGASTSAGKRFEMLDSNRNGAIELAAANAAGIDTGRFSAMDVDADERVSMTGFLLAPPAKESGDPPGSRDSR